MIRCTDKTLLELSPCNYKTYPVMFGGWIARFHHTVVQEQLKKEQEISYQETGSVVLSLKIASCLANEGVTTQMKVLDEYILMVLFVLLLNRAHYLSNEVERSHHSNESSRCVHS